MPKRWLFITYTSDPKRPALDLSARYRCFAPAEELRAHGIEAAVISQQRFEREPPLHYDVYVFHRPWYSQDFESLVDFLRARGRRVLADYDEPAFAAPLSGRHAAPFPELISSGASPERRFERALRIFPVISAATRPLADWILHLQPDARVEVVPTSLSRSWREATDTLEGEGKPVADRLVGLCSLGPILRPDHELLDALIGSAPENFARRLLLDAATAKAFGSRLAGAHTLRKGTSRRSVLTRCHTILVPCKTTSVTACASAVSYFEAAWLGCRVFSPPLPDFTPHEGKGVTTIATEEDWAKAFRRAFDPSTAEETARAKAHVRAHAVSETHTRRLIHRIESGNP